jgi:hypothetical protein
LGETSVELKRVQIKTLETDQGKVHALEQPSKEGINLCLAAEDSPISVSFSPREQALGRQLMLYLKKKGSMTMSSLTTAMMQYDPDYSSKSAPELSLLVTFLRNVKGGPIDKLQLREEGVRDDDSYRNNPTQVLDLRPGKVRAVMNPFVSNCKYAPARGNEDDILDAITERIVVPQASDYIGLNSHYRPLATKFAQFVIAEGGKFSLADQEQLEEKLTRPTQRIIHEEAERGSLKQKETLSIFEKNEAMKLGKPMRIITTPAATDKNVLARIYVPATSVLKKTHWYAFGYGPRQMARRVAEKIQHARDTVLGSDFKFMDGTVSARMREPEQVFLMLASAPRDRAFIHTNYERTHNNIIRVKARLGRFVPTAETQGSGLADTSFAQSYRNAFTAFCTYVNMGYTPEEAYSALGMYGGDDGLSADLDPRVYEITCKYFGLHLKREVFKKGQPVLFLGRYWGPGAWSTGNPTTVCDISRFFKQFHLSGMDADDKMALGIKARSYCITDAATPIIGHIVLKLAVLATAGAFYALINENSRAVRYDTRRSFALGQENWYQQPEDDYCWVELLLQEFDPLWLGRLREWIESDDLLHPPVLDTGLAPELKTHVTALVGRDGDVRVLAKEMKGHKLKEKAPIEQPARGFKSVGMQPPEKLVVKDVTKEGNVLKKIAKAQKRNIRFAARILGKGKAYSDTHRSEIKQTPTVAKETKDNPVDPAESKTAPVDSPSDKKVFKPRPNPLYVRHIAETEEKYPRKVDSKPAPIGRLVVARRLVKWHCDKVDKQMSAASQDKKSDDGGWKISKAARRKARRRKKTNALKRQ